MNNVYPFPNNYGADKPLNLYCVEDELIEHIERDYRDIDHTIESISNMHPEIEEMLDRIRKENRELMERFLEATKDIASLEN